MILSVEEPDVVAITIRPGLVDTDMQRDIREKHVLSMNEKESAFFSNLPTSGKLLKAEEPGNIIARLVLNVPSELSGKSLE